MGSRFPGSSAASRCDGVTERTGVVENIVCNAGGIVTRPTEQTLTSLLAQARRSRDSSSFLGKGNVLKGANTLQPAVSQPESAPTSLAPSLGPRPWAPLL